MTVNTYDPFTEEITEEVITAVRTQGKWHFAAKRISSLFTLVLSDRWEQLQDAPYYEQYFKYLIAVLNKQPNHLVEVTMTVKYRYAAIPEKDVRRYMDDWRDDWEQDKLTEFIGQAVQVSQRGTDPDHTVSICLMTPISYDVEALDE